MNNQFTLFADPELPQALASWEASDSEKGEVFTKPEIVRFMISVSGLQGRMLDDSTSVLEPSCGQGEFVIAIVEALVEEITKVGSRPSMDQLENKLRAYDLVEANIQEAKKNVERILSQFYSHSEIDFLFAHWFKEADFLLSDIEQRFSHIVGNPPYIRVENIPKKILSEYRDRFSTMCDRADIYVAFFEKALSLLADNGRLSFICTDRWVKNQYGKALRALIDNKFSLDMYVDLYGQESFQSKVLTYPAVTLMSRSKKRPTVVVHNPKIDDRLTKCVISSIESGKSNCDGVLIRSGITNGGEPWLLGCPDELALVRKLESNFRLIEDVGCRVYIGAATGNNKVYIVDQDLDIESDRKLPVVTAADIRKGVIESVGKCIINTYDDSGVIDLEAFPKLKSYLEESREVLSGRHIAKLSQNNWFKTIDRVYPERAKSEKLLIPDIKSELAVIYDSGVYHPNNSIYYICSNTWDLRALKAVLISGIGKLFVQTYSTKVANDFLRFQAQHLRRIRIPDWFDIDHKTKMKLISAGEKNDLSLARELMAMVYDLNHSELQVIGG